MGEDDLSADVGYNATDRILRDSAPWRPWSAHAVSTGTMSVTIPAGTAPGSYFLLACADDAGQVAESVETSNCLASTGKVTVTVGP